MKVSKFAWLAAAVVGISSGTAQAQQHGAQYGAYGNTYSQQRSLAVQPVSHGSGSVATVSCGCGEPACGCEHVLDPTCGLEATCDTACGPAASSCCLGEPWSLFGEYNGWTAGGWAQLGYHSQRGGARFNQHPDRFNLHQAWLYAEKGIDTSCGFDIGGRIDYVYGVDAQDTQAFGRDNGHWDTDWDHGIYGHALPQAYLEAGYGDLSVKVGKFFTIIGWEVVPAPDNFFYSHAYTMVNSEPFTHTGVLATYKVSNDVTAYGGYTFGWDSGYEDNGDNFIGGLSYALTDDVRLTYATVGGRFNELVGERGYMHSVVLDTTLTDRLQYVFQTDLLDTDDAAGNTYRNTIGINQYLIYKINDCWSAGTRVEWWNIDTDATGVGLAAGDADIYDVTFGLNYRPHANVLIRPELRVDYVNDEAVAVAGDLTENDRSTQTTFGVDTIFLF